MKILAGVAAVAAISIVSPALSDSNIDMSKLTCEEFVKYDKDNMGSIMMWVEGYYTGDNDDPIVDFTKMAGDTAKILVYCGDHPKDDLITAADAVMGKDSGDNDEDK